VSDGKSVLPPGAGPFERHVFVCVSGGTCPSQGAEAIHAAMKAAAKERLGPVVVRVNKSGCLGQCGHGPMVCVYPENVWYAGVAAADVPEIVESHLGGGSPVERLLFRGHHAGPNVVPAGPPANSGAPRAGGGENSRP
jgi:(2Fe-2S) ferredoxin